MIKNKYAISWIFITSTIQFFTLLLFIIFTTIVLTNEKGTGFSFHANDWLSANWISTDNNSLQELLKNNGWMILYQSFIIIAIASLILFFLMGILSVINFCKLKCLDDPTRKVYLIYAIFGFVMFWKWYLITKSNPKGELKNQIFSDFNAPSIDHKIFWNSIINFKTPTNQTITTGFYYLLLLSTTFGFAIIWISYGIQFPLFESKIIVDPTMPIGIFKTLDSLQREFISLSPFTSTLTYYTQLTNFACLIYAWIALCKPKANIFRNNTLSIQISTYIIIVGVVYWIALFDSESFISDFPEVNKLMIPGLISTIVTHGTTPFIFFFYSLILINYNRVQPVKYWKSFDLFLIYPLTYGIFLYLVPLFSIISIYGDFSNINPNNIIVDINPDNIIVENPGNPIWLLGLPVLGIAFSFVYFIIWIYACLITKKPLFNQKNI